MAFGLKCKSVVACSLVSAMANSFSRLCVNANISSKNYGISTKKFGGYKAQKVSETSLSSTSSKSNRPYFLVKFFGVLILILASIYALLLFFKCKNEGNPKDSKSNPVQKDEKENKQSFSKNNESKNSLIEIKGKEQPEEGPDRIIAKEDKKFEKEDSHISRKYNGFEANYVKEKKDACFGVLKLKSKSSNCINKKEEGGKVLYEETMLDNVEVEIGGDNMVSELEKGLYGWN